MVQSGKIVKLEKDGGQGNMVVRENSEIMGKWWSGKRVKLGKDGAVKGNL